MVATIMDGIIPTQRNYCLDMSIKELLSRVKAFLWGSVVWPPTRLPVKYCFGIFPRSYLHDAFSFAVIAITPQQNPSAEYTAKDCF